MGQSLTMAASMQCPHGGTVTAVTSNVTTKASSTPILRLSDTFTVAGCVFTLPGPKPSPCVRVQWIVPDVRVRVGSQPTLSKSSQGICFSADSIPQGPVNIVSTQSKVTST